MGGGGQLCRDICLCAWGAKNRQAFFVMPNATLVDIWWQLNGMWGYFLFAI